MKWNEAPSRKRSKDVVVEPGFGRHGSALRLADKLLVCSEKGNLVLVDPSPEACKVLAQFPLGAGFATEKMAALSKSVRAPNIWWNEPIFVVGRLYCRSYLGCVACVDIAVRRTP